MSIDCNQEIKKELIATVKGAYCSDECKNIFPLSVKRDKDNEKECRLLEYPRWLFKNDKNKYCRSCVCMDIFGKKE